MTVNRRFLYGGVFLVAAGAVMLIAQGDAVNNDALTAALRLWPVAIIALGVGLLLRRTRFGLAGGMLAAAMPGLLLGGLVVAAPRFVTDCGVAGPAGIATRQGTFAGAATVDLTLKCGNVLVTTAPGDAWQLQPGDITGAAATVSASTDRLSVISSGTRHPFDFFSGPRPQLNLNVGFGQPPVFNLGSDAWQLSLPTANRLDLTAEVDAGRGRFDLAGAQLGNARFVVNAGDARVDLSEATLDHLSVNVSAASAAVRLPTRADFSANLSVSAGSLSVCASSDLGLRIQDQAVLASVHYNGLIRNGNTWESPGYATATHHADVNITANVGSVDINPIGGCQ